MKIGVLVPQSKIHPSIGKDFLDGIRLVPELKDKLEVKIENIGIGSDHVQIMNAVQKLVLQEEVNLILGLVGHKGIDKLIGFITESEVPTLISDLGAKILPSNSSEWFFRNSFALEDSLMAFRQVIQDNEYKNIMTSSCFNNVGYDFMVTLTQSIEEKAEFCGHFITPVNPRPNEAELMKAASELMQPDAIFGYHNGIYANENADFINKNNLLSTNDYYTHYFGWDPKWYDQMHGSFCISSWMSKLNTEENQKFVRIYEDHKGKQPSPFVLLGYENGLVIKDIIDNTEGTLNPYKVKDGLKTCKIKGPRGIIEFDPNEQKSQYEQQLWKLEKEENVVQPNLIKSLGKHSFNNSEISELSSGWDNAYLCE